MTAENLAEARRNFAQADSTYQVLKAKARSIEDRIAVARAKQVEITNKRVNGTATDADTAEFGALAADIDLLDSMLSEAQAAASTKSPEHERNLLSQAETMHQRAADKQKFEALQQTSQRLDAALCDAIRQTHEFGKRLGHVSLTQSWRPSDTLHRAISYSVPPGGTV